MKLNFIYILIFAVTSSQCNRELDTKYQEQILGEWYIGSSDSLMTKSFSNVFETRNCGFSFEKDGKCTFLPGFIQLLDQNLKKDRFHSFGYISTYRLKNDSLSIFDLRTKSWQSAFIERLEKDTLILKFEKKKLKFYKKHESTHLNQLQFDEIILSSYNRGTNGPEFNILIKENGSILFSGQDYTNIQGLYSSKNNKLAFENLRTLINDINFDHINLENHIETTHEYSRNLLLIKDKKVVKSLNIFENDLAVNIDLDWAVNYLGFLYQNVPLDTLQLKSDNLLGMKDIRFVCKNRNFDLNKSCSFYIWSLLLNAEVSNQPFIKKYQIKYQQNNKPKVGFTDGKIYEFKTNSNSTVKLDLGFDFLENYIGFLNEVGLKY